MEWHSPRLIQIYTQASALTFDCSHRNRWKQGNGENLWGSPVEAQSVAILPAKDYLTLFGAGGVPIDPPHC